MTAHRRGVVSKRDSFSIGITISCDYVMTATKLQNTTFLKRGKVELRNFEFRMSSVNTYYVMRTKKKKRARNVSHAR